LVALGAEVATQKKDFERFKNKFLNEATAEELGREILRLEAGREFKVFEQPGATLVNAALHLSRTIARRAEREAWKLKEKGKLKRELR